MNKKTIRDIDLKGKKVFVRCDFNVPMNEERKITDNTRIVAALPTIKYLLEQKCKIILASHLGRPKGEFKPESLINCTKLLVPAALTNAKYSSNAFFQSLFDLLQNSKATVCAKQ